MRFTKDTIDIRLQRGRHVVCSDLSFVTTLKLRYSSERLYDVVVLKPFSRKKCKLLSKGKMTRFADFSRRLSNNLVNLRSEWMEESVLSAAKRGT